MWGKREDGGKGERQGGWGGGEALDETEKGEIN